MYELLERQVAPEFYDRDPNGIPVAWVARIRESMARLTPQFSANRVVREYTQEHYFPAATVYRARAAQKGAIGKRIVDWQRLISEKWGTLRFGEVNVLISADSYVFEVQVHLGELDGDAVRVEIYANGLNGSAAITQEMMRIRPSGGDGNSYVYSGKVPSNRSVNDYTPRILPHFTDVSVPLEAPQILWQR